MPKSRLVRFRPPAWAAERESATLPLDATRRQTHTCPMNVELLVERLRDGFRPFALRLSDGRAFRVPHPEFIAVSPLAVVVMDQRGLPVHIDPAHIVSLDDVPAKRPPSARR